MSNLAFPREILKELDIPVDLENLEELAAALGGGNDFMVELDGVGYRFIDEEAIDDIYTEEITELVKDCYLGISDAHWWIEIDWEKTAKDVRDSDSYGNHFSCYDGSKEYVSPWYIFRVS